MQKVHDEQNVKKLNKDGISNDAVWSQKEKSVK